MVLTLGGRGISLNRNHSPNHNPMNRLRRVIKIKVKIMIRLKRS